MGLLGAILTGYLLRAMFYHRGAASAPVLAAALALLAFSALAAVAIYSGTTREPAEPERNVAV